MCAPQGCTGWGPGVLQVRLWGRWGLGEGGEGQPRLPAVSRASRDTAQPLSLPEHPPGTGLRLVLCAVLEAGCPPAQGSALPLHW